MIRSSVRTAAGVLTAGCLLSLAAGAQTTTLSPRWSHQSGLENWVARQVSLGNEGTEVFSQLDVNGLSRRLFTEGSASTAQPVWQSIEGQQTFYQRVASCNTKSIHAAVRDKVTTGGHQLELTLFKSASSLPLWSFETPAQAGAYSSFDVMITADGERVVLANYRSAIGRTEVRVFAPGSQTPISSYELDTYGAPAAYRLSNDGTRLYAGSALAASLFSLTNGQLVYRRNLTSQVGGQDIAGNGDSFAFGLAGGACVFSSTLTGTWGVAFCRQVTPGAFCTGVEISPDSRRMAISYALPTNVSSAVVELIDLEASLAQGSAVVLWSYSVPVTTGFENLTSDLEFSNDGRTLAVGLWGDQGGPSPEILVFKNDDPVPAFRADLPGSVQSLGLSPDGRRLVSASKSVHNSTFAGDGSIDFYELGDLRLRVTNVPHANGTVTLEAHTTPDRPVRLFASMGRVDVPTQVGNIPGLLTIDRMRIISAVSMTRADMNGVSTKSWPLVGIPVGTSVYFQAVALDPREVVEDWCKVTVVAP